MKDVEFKKIPNNLRRYRMTRGLTQRDVAKALNLMSAGMVSQREKRVRAPNLINVSKFAGLYRVLADALFYGLLRNTKEKIVERNIKQ